MQLATIPLILSGPVGSSSNGVPLAVPVAQLKARRDGESDADYFGVQYLYKAGYDPKCFVSFVQRIWGSGITPTTKTPKVFSTYPPLDERLATLESEISKILPMRDGAKVSTSEFDALLERLRAQKSDGPKTPTLRTPSHGIPNLP
jgi:predicted Zn-dependent protease